MPRVLGLFLLSAGVLLCVLGGIGVVVGLGELQRGGQGILFVFGTLAVVGVALLVTAVAVLRRSKPFTGPASRSGGTDLYPADKPVEDELDGTRYARQYTPPTTGKNARPSALTFRTAVACDGEFQMIPETPFDRLGKQFGLAVEVQTGDRKFDDECYVRSDTPAFAAAYLTDPLKRIAILDLRRLGFQQVALSGGDLSATWTGFDPVGNHRDGLTVDVAARLLVLSRNLPEPRPKSRDGAVTRRKVCEAALWAFLVVLGLSVTSVWRFPAADTGDLMIRAIGAMFLAVPLVAFVAARMLRGTSRSHLAWARVMIAALFLVPLGCAGTIAFANGAFDDSPDAVRTPIVVEKYTKKGKNSTSYHARCASWKRGGGTLSFGISGNDYGAIVPQQSRLVLTTGSGWLGIEWVKSQRVDARPGH